MKTSTILLFIAVFAVVLLIGTMLTVRYFIDKNISPQPNPETSTLETSEGSQAHTRLDDALEETRELRRQIEARNEEE